MTGNDVVQMEYHCVLLGIFYSVSNTWIARIELKLNITQILKNYYLIIAMPQTLHILLSTQQHTLPYFQLKTPYDYCTSNYPVPIACPLAHLLF